MSNFRPFFFFARICLNFCMWASLYSKNIALYFFSLICSSFARKNICKKKQAFPGGVFLRSFVERETKETFCLSEQ